MKVLLFWWLQSQSFYQKLHKDAVCIAGIEKHTNSTTPVQWADIGCGVGLMSRIVVEQGYEVYSYDLDSSMIFWAKFLNRNRCNVFYEQKDVMNLFCLFDVVSATSLLSVVPNKKEVLEKLQSLLKTEKSKLILIEPTQEMTVKNVFKMMKDIKTFKYYFMFLIWAKARQNKEIDSNIFKEIKNISYHYFLSNMVRVTIIGQR